jgi:chaperone required for assembly of F1-ATPase
LSAPKLKRFYDEVAVVPIEHGFVLRLDGKPLRTPEQNSLTLPTAFLAEGLAKEWRAPGEYVIPQTMPFTKLAFTAVDRVRPDREAVIEQISAYVNSDVVCYRASEPSDLVERQRENWDPIVEWAVSAFNVSIRTGEGIGHIAQAYDTLCALTAVFSDKSNFYLTALYALAANGNSLMIALAVAVDGMDADEAFRSANCDELYQSEKWGRDPEAQARLQKRAEEFGTAANFLELLGERDHKR